MTVKLPGLDQATAALTNAATRFGNAAATGIANKASQVLSDAINKKVGNLLDFSNTGIGKALGKIGIGSDFSQYMGGGTGAGWMAKASARPDPLLQIDWYVIMPFGLTAEYVESVAVPKSNYAASPGVFMAGQRMYFAEAMDTATVSIAFYEDVRMTAHAYINAWKARISNPNGTRNPPAYYKAPITLLAMDVKGNVLGRLVMQGCWPQTESNYDATSGNSERVIVTVEFTCDRVDVEVNGAAISTPSIGASLGDTLSSFLSGGIAKISQSASAFASNALASVKSFF